MQIVQSSAGITQAQSALAAAKLNLQTLEARAGVQPKLTAAAIAQAEANYNVAVKDLESFQRVSAPQTRAQVQGDLRQSQAAMETAKAAYQRNQTLLSKGYVSQAATDASRSAYEAAAAAYANAKVRSDKLDDDLRIQQQSAEARVDQSQAALATARANGIAVGSSVRDLLQAREQVRQAEAALAEAKSNRKQVDVQRAELRAATAAILRSKISRDNAKVQLDSTTVVAPRDGVVVVKYLEEGTIIPPGTSVFSEGTSIVQLADVSRMYVEVMADEADITNVRLGQSVRVRLEASPDHPILGKVSRINPGAITNDGVTQVKVRVEVNKTPGVKLMPGLNASCEFIEREVKHVLMVPSPAIQREGKKTFVEVMVQPNKTVRREVVTGASGNSMVEILKGLSEGENVVTSKIDKRQIEDQQKKMEEASQERNPFSGGRQGGGARR
jgi:HlyD family secretion protein